MLSAKFERIRRGLMMKRAVRPPDGVLVRVAAPSIPFDGSVAVEPDLEDAFVHLMQPSLTGTRTTHGD